MCIPQRQDSPPPRQCTAALLGGAQDEELPARCHFPAMNHVPGPRSLLLLASRPPWSLVHEWCSGSPQPACLISTQQIASVFDVSHSTALLLKIPQCLNYLRFITSGSPSPLTAVLIASSVVLHAAGFPPAMSPLPSCICCSLGPLFTVEWTPLSLPPCRFLFRWHLTEVSTPLLKAEPLLQPGPQAFLSRTFKWTHMDITYLSHINWIQNLCFPMFGGFWVFCCAALTDLKLFLHVSVC